MELITQRKEVAGELRAAIARNGIRHGELAAALGVNPNVLARKLNGNAPVGLEEVVAISRVLGVKPTQLIHAALDAAA